MIVSRRCVPEKIEGSPLVTLYIVEGVADFHHEQSTVRQSGGEKGGHPRLKKSGNSGNAENVEDSEQDEDLAGGIFTGFRVDVLNSLAESPG